MPSTTEFAGRILEIFSRKGWDLYRRGPSGSRPGMEHVLAQGPVADSLEERIIYELHPRAIRSMTLSEATAFFKRHKVNAPSVIAPEGILLGRAVVQFGDGHEDDTDERPLFSGEVIQFQGFELLGEEVRLISQTRVYMPPNVFLAALETLADVTTLAVRRTW